MGNGVQKSNWRTKEATWEAACDHASGPPLYRVNALAIFLYFHISHVIIDNIFLYLYLLSIHTRFTLIKVEV